MKIQKVKLRGYSRRVYALAFVIVFALAGTGYILYSKAATPTVVNTQLGMMAGTSPSSYNNIIAFQANTSELYYYNVTTGQSVNTHQPMMAGTSPSISNNIIAYQGSGSGLAYWNISTGKALDTKLGMMKGTSPSVYGNTIAFQASTTTLYTYDIPTGSSINTFQGMMAGTSPSVSGNYVAFQANTTNLYYWNLTTYQSTNTQQGMLRGTSPSLNAFMKNLKIAFQGNTGQLFLYDSTKGYSTNTQQGMMAGTSPSLYGNIISFNHSSGGLYFYNTSSLQAVATGQGMMAGTSPSTYGDNLAFQGTATSLYYFIPSLPTVTLTGPASVNSGQGPTLKYTTSNTHSCSLAGYTFDPTQSIDGSFNAPSITTTTSYALSCQSETGNATVEAYWIVGVVGPPSGGISGPATVGPGDSPDLTISTANVANCTVNGAAVSPNGTYTAPGISAYTTYELKCGGADGTGTALIASTAVSVTQVDYGDYAKSGVFYDPNAAPTANTASTGTSAVKGWYHVQPFVTIGGSSVIGVSADIQTASPRVNGACDKGHSLAQIGIHNVNGRKDISAINGVEFGWTVACSHIPGDTKPRLFVENVINGYGNYTQGTTHGWINCCGFVSTSSLKPGHSLGEGTVHNFKIYYSAATARWNLYFDGQPFGYYNASNFKKYSGYDFTYASQASAWGEVYQPGGRCIQMGNGKRGGTTGAAFIKNIQTRYSGGWTNAYLRRSPMTIDNPYNYNIGDVLDNSFTYGGNGTC